MDFIRSSPTCTGTRDAEQPSGSFCARIDKCIQKIIGICVAHASATINLEFTSPTTVTVSGSYAANYPGGNKADNIAPTTETFSFQPDSNQAVVNLPAGASPYSPSISIECAAPRSPRGNPGLGVTVLCLVVVRYCPDQNNIQGSVTAHNVPIAGTVTIDADATPGAC